MPNEAIFRVVALRTPPEHWRGTDRVELLDELDGLFQIRQQYQCIGSFGERSLMLVPPRERIPHDYRYSGKLLIHVPIYDREDIH